MESFEWFDCFAAIGLVDRKAPRFAPDADALLAEMDFCGLSEALVYHAAHELDSPQVANPLIAEACQKRPRLHPTWALLPPQTEELGTVPEFLAAMRRHRVKALRAYPDRHRYLLNRLTLGSLFEELIPRRIPLLLGPDWPRLTSLLADFPDLTIIVVRRGDWGDDRYCRPLLERYPRLYLDTSYYQQDGGLEAHVARYGPDRLLFGSGFPERQMGGPQLLLAACGIPDDAKAAIAGGNLRRLLSEVNL